MLKSSLSRSSTSHWKFHKLKSLLAETNQVLLHKDHLHKDDLYNDDLHKDKLQ